MTGLLDRLGIMQGSIVLNIGFGRATELLDLSEIVGREGTVYGVELDSSHRREVLGQIPQGWNIGILSGDAHNVPLPDRSVDFVLFKGVLHEIEGVSEALLEAKRTSKINGRILVVDFQPFPRRWLTESNLKWRFHHPKSLFGPTLDRHAGFSKMDLEAFMKKAGLSLEGYRDNFAAGTFAGHHIPLFLAVGRRWV